METPRHLKPRPDAHRLSSSRKRSASTDHPWQSSREATADGDAEDRDDDSKRRKHPERPTRESTILETSRRIFDRKAQRERRRRLGEKGYVQARQSPSPLPQSAPSVHQDSSSDSLLPPPRQQSRVIADSQDEDAVEDDEMSFGSPPQVPLDSVEDQEQQTASSPVGQAPDAVNVDELLLLADGERSSPDWEPDSDDASESSFENQADSRRKSVSKKGRSIPASRPTSSPPQPSPAEPVGSLQRAGRRKYQRLLDDMQRDINTHFDPSLAFNSETAGPPSQIGFSWWTAEEKHRFFAGVSRFGYHDTAKLSHLVHSKSAIEVQQYVNVLHDVIAQDKPRIWFQDHYIPGAAEVGSEACAALETAADGFLETEALADAESEKDRFGHYWLLDDFSTGKLEQRLETVQDDIKRPLNLASNGLTHDAQSSLLPAAALFHLPVWIELATYMFMNRSGPVIRKSPPTRRLSEPAIKQDPSQFHASMFASAAVDFHDVAIAITRRLVAASLFQAMSRLRATDRRSDRDLAGQVYTSDVEAAIDVLGMPRDSIAFWACVPRRNSLDVYDYERSRRHWPLLMSRDISRIESKGALGQRMEYDEVERALGLRSSTNEASPEHANASDENEDERQRSRSPSPELSISSTSSRSPSPSSAHELRKVAAVLSKEKKKVPPSPPLNDVEQVHPSQLRRPESPPWHWTAHAPRATEWEVHGTFRPQRPTEVDKKYAHDVRLKWRLKASKYYVGGGPKGARGGTSDRDGGAATTTADEGGGDVEMEDASGANVEVSVAGDVNMIEADDSDSESEHESNK